MSEHPIRAVVFDWAGTMIDFGCCAPVKALRQVFADQGMALDDETARRDMGRAKLDHLRAILADPAMSRRWAAHKAAVPSEDDVQQLYAALVPAMRAAASETARLIPGAAEVAARLRAQGVRIGSGTGYTREMMGEVLPRASEQGYAPEVVVCAGETPSGRPAPLMTWKALIALDAWPANRCVKVDDAPVGIEEGRLAGCWTIGVSASGNGVGLDRDAYQALAPSDRRERVLHAETALKAAGADFVVADVSELAPVLDEIARRVARN